MRGESCRPVPFRRLGILTNSQRGTVFDGVDGSGSFFFSKKKIRRPAGTPIQLNQERRAEGVQQYQQHLRVDDDTSRNVFNDNVHTSCDQIMVIPMVF